MNSDRCNKCLHPLKTNIDGMVVDTDNNLVLHIKICPLCKATNEIRSGG